KMIKTGADVYEGLIVGCVVVVAVAFTQLRQAGRRGKQLFPGALGIVTIVILSLLTGILAMLFTQRSVLTPNEAKEIRETGVLAMLLTQGARGRWIGGVAALAALLVLGAAAVLERRRSER